MNVSKLFVLSENQLLNCKRGINNPSIKQLLEGLGEKINYKK